ncbi:alpha glucosidase/alpha-xylosidase [Nitritalea halalkaliphila LW7]|uniref:Alpha glucosidase/alpha-xylosidase n=1 Tax=Nitritalea halalkaliphila LW7 TaxID=1189621 RepID=I5BTM3_9BACT|nr:alpha-xylosidase [Nitritalea halalkaliphila]EIM72925.1 alpha glucosidase/alpha-xylosidase [Nitritalea halalkaliphila LW7]
MAFGVLYGAYTNQEQSIQLIQDIVAHEYPIDAFWIDSWIWDWENEGKGPAKYMDFVADTVSYPDMEAMWTFMEEKNIKAGMWMWDAIQLTGNEQAYADFKDRGYFKEEIIHTSSWHNGSRTTIMDDQSQSVQGTWMGNIDFENPEAVAYFKQRVQHFFDKGVDFVKLDKTDDLHVVKAMFELSQELGKESAGRGFVLSHSGGVEDERYKRYPAKWTDDTRSDWTVADPQRSFSPWLPPVAFRENLEMYTDTAQHFHKIPFLANDMGGFAVSEDRFLDEELYIRWVQMAHWLPLTTPFAQPENETGNIAFKVSPKADSVFRKYAQQKMRLFPYIYSYAHRTRWEGKNAVRTVPGQLHTYQLGEEFLISPVLAPDLTSQEVFLPIGNWWSTIQESAMQEGGL